MAGPVDWAGWMDDGCVPVAGKAMSWPGVEVRDSDMSPILMDVSSGRLQAMGGETGFLRPARVSLRMPRGNLSANVGSWMGRLKGQSSRRTQPPKTHSRLRDRPKLEFATWKTACFRESGILAFEPCPGLWQPSETEQVWSRPASSSPLSSSDSSQSCSCCRVRPQVPNTDLLAGLPGEGR